MNEISKHIMKRLKQIETEIPKSWVGFIDSVSPELISKSWGSIQLSDDKMTFDQAWKKLKEIFEKMDLS